MILKQGCVTPDISIFYQYLVKEKGQSPFSQSVKYAAHAAFSFIVCSLLHSCLLNIGFPSWDDYYIVTMVPKCPL